MNLLRVQDALKNASDQQLMAMMQAPDSTAPSYLVLSELRRRKDMRQKQETGEDSQKTVAEELAAPQQQAQEPVGIRGLQQAPVDPDGVDATQGGDVQAMSGGGIANVRHYAEGGTVYGNEGIVVVNGVAYPVDEYERMAVPPRLQPPRSSNRRLTPEENAAFYSGTELPRPDVERENTLRRPSPPREQVLPSNSGNDSRAANREVPSVASLYDAPEYTRVSPLVLEEPRSDVRASDQYGPPAPEGYRAANQPSERPPALPPQGTSERETQRADGIRALSAARGGGGGGGGAGGGGGGDGLPTLAEVYRRNAELFPDTMGGIRQRMEEGRIDPAARRQEAVNMALIEAGLRIAGSRNPSLIGAIGEGALPAVQSYGQQLGQIRSEQRQALRDDLELAKQEVNRQYAIGQISAAEHRSRMEIISRQQQAAMSEARADRRAGRSEAAADRRFAQQQALAVEQDRRRGNISYEEYMRMTPEQRQAFEATRTINRPADVSGLAPVLNAAERRLTELRAEFDKLPSAPSQTSWGSPNPRYTEWVRRRDELRSRITQAEGRVRELENTFYYGRGSSQQNRTPSATAPTTTGERPPLSSFMGQ